MILVPAPAHSKSLNCGVFYSYITSQSGLAIVQVLESHVQLVAAVPDSIVLESLLCSHLSSHFFPVTTYFL